MPRKMARFRGFGPDGRERCKEFIKPLKYVVRAVCTTNENENQGAFSPFNLMSKIFSDFFFRHNFKEFDSKKKKLDISFLK
jgi:hypothetical protein